MSRRYTNAEPDLRQRAGGRCAMTPPEREIRAIATLAEPTRRRLYEYVSSRADPVGRDAAAAALGITRPLAAFHLDRLVQVGLLATEYRRLTARSGPGAGRPAKLYRVSPTGIELSIPSRQHRLLSEWLAGALSALPGTAAGARLRSVAGAYGEELGQAARALAGRQRSVRSRIHAGAKVLAGEGFAPRIEGDGVLLGNCPFQPVAQAHRPLICNDMNRALMGAFAAVLNAGLVASYEPGSNGCCVALRPAR